jgi:tetratricopeptide (TPR) repeat protein
MQLYVGELEDAASNLNRSVSVLERLKGENPNDLRIHRELEEALYASSVTLEELGREQESAKSIQRLLTLRRKSLEIEPASVASRIRLLSVLARAGELVEGTKLARELDQSLGKDDTARYDLACGYAQLSRTRGELSEGEATADVPSQAELVEASIAALRDALAAGFFRQTDLHLDPDLDPVRELPEFEEVIAKRIN